MNRLPCISPAVCSEANAYCAELGKRLPNFMNNELNHFDEGQKVIHYIPAPYRCPLHSTSPRYESANMQSIQNALALTQYKRPTQPFFLWFDFVFFLSLPHICTYICYIYILFIIRSHPHFHIGLIMWETWTINGNLSTWYDTKFSQFLAWILHTLTHRTFITASLTQTTVTKSFGHLEKMIVVVEGCSIYISFSSSPSIAAIATSVASVRMKNIINFHRIFLSLYWENGRSLPRNGLFPCTC